MPARKLSQADLDDLREADSELLRSSNPRRIIRPASNGGRDIEITTQAGIAAWKGISESHFHALKRNGWKFKRGVPYEDRPPENDLVSATLLRTTFDLLQERIEAKDRRIAELEADLEALRHERNRP